MITKRLWGTPPDVLPLGISPLAFNDDALLFVWRDTNRRGRIVRITEDDITTKLIEIKPTDETYSVGVDEDKFPCITRTDGLRWYSTSYDIDLAPTEDDEDYTRFHTLNQDNEVTQWVRTNSPLNLVHLIAHPQGDLVGLHQRKDGGYDIYTLTPPAEEERKTIAEEEEKEEEKTPEEETNLSLPTLTNKEWFHYSRLMAELGKRHDLQKMKCSLWCEQTPFIKSEDCEWYICDNNFLIRGYLSNQQYWWYNLVTGEHTTPTTQTSETDFRSPYAERSVFVLERVKEEVEVDVGRVVCAVRDGQELYRVRLRADKVEVLL